MTVFNEPCEALTNWANGGVAGAATIVAGRTANAIQLVTNAVRAWTWGAAADPVKSGIWFKTTSLSVSIPAFTLASTGNNNTTIRVNTDGSVTPLLGGSGGSVIGGPTAAGLVAVNTWVQLEVFVKLGTGANADGSLTLWVDGTQRLALTNVKTQINGTITTLNNVRLAGLAGPTLLVDDVYVDSAPPVGGKANVWNGSAFVDSVAVKTWTGSAFVDSVAVKTWNGSAWVDAI